MVYLKNEGKQGARIAFGRVLLTGMSLPEVYCRTGAPLLYVQSASKKISQPCEQWGYEGTQMFP